MSINEKICILIWIPSSRGVSAESQTIHSLEYHNLTLNRVIQYVPNTERGVCGNRVTNFQRLFFSSLQRSCLAPPSGDVVDDPH